MKGRTIHSPKEKYLLLSGKGQIAKTLIFSELRTSLKISQNEILQDCRKPCYIYSSITLWKDDYW